MCSINFTSVDEADACILNARLHPNDRVLLMGDRRQHEAFDASYPFSHLQQAGMKTVSLGQIVH